ncbi:MAG: CDP-archaeol synthase [Gammaproteobacteria bacterium]|nr:CDP-archaeol synthase [Gammaproteobacteria bacterium]
MTIELLHLLLLIIIANGAPILLRLLLNDSFKLAVDFGQKLPDNKRIFGPSKTWRGIVAALSATTLVAWLLGYSVNTGLLVAIYSVLGDLFSSFIKRRLGMPASSMALLLDQVPESLLPAFMMMKAFNLDISSVILLVLTFIITELILSHIFYKWGVRRRPY